MLLVAEDDSTPSFRHIWENYGVDVSLEWFWGDLFSCCFLFSLWAPNPPCYFESPQLGENNASWQSCHYPYQHLHHTHTRPSTPTHPFTEDQKSDRKISIWVTQYSNVWGLMRSCETISNLLCHYYQYFHCNIYLTFIFESVQPFWQMKYHTIELHEHFSKTPYIGYIKHVCACVRVMVFEYLSFLLEYRRSLSFIYWQGTYSDSTLNGKRWLLGFIHTTLLNMVFILTVFCSFFLPLKTSLFFLFVNREHLSSFVYCMCRKLLS